MTTRSDWMLFGLCLFASIATFAILTAVPTAYHHDRMLWIGVAVLAASFLAFDAVAADRPDRGRFGALLLVVAISVVVVMAVPERYYRGWLFWLGAAVVGALLLVDSYVATVRA